ncbi:hypothetical protein JW835_11260 [bacterium]|nr:hypothetical protein [bacterium]
MKTYNNRLVPILSMLIYTINITAQVLYHDIGHIPVQYQEEWHQAGLLKKITAADFYDVTQETGSSIADQIKTALDKARGDSRNGKMSIIYFPEGIYEFTGPVTPFDLTYPDSNIVFLGDGADKTVIKLSRADVNGFDIHGRAGNYQNLNRDIYKGESVIHGDLSGINPGDWIHITERLFRYDPDKSIDKHEKGIVGQISRLELKDINGSEGQMKDRATKTYSVVNDYDSTNLKIRKVLPVKNIGIENLTIKRLSCGKTAVDGKGYNIKFGFAVNCWVKGVESDNTSRAHISVSHSTHMEISGCYCHHAEHYGGGGYGYGIVLYGATTNSLVENNIFRYLRHALVIGGGANCNVWAYNYSREQHSTWKGIFYDDRDLDLHAKYPYGNLYEQNYICRIGADDFHGLNGPYNTFVRNYVYHEAKNKNELIHLDNGDLTNILGNILGRNNNWESIVRPDMTFVYDLYGIWITQNQTYETGKHYTHNQVAQYNYKNRFEYYLSDISYYYTERPAFLTADFTWPCLGPKTKSTVCCQTIPARERYYDKIYTYNPDPTRIP